MKTCNTCEHWKQCHNKKLNEMGYGTCNEVGWHDDDYPHNTQEQAVLNIFVLDDSGLSPDLCTRADFGCTMYKGKTDLDDDDDAEAERGILLEKLEKLGWPCSLVDLPDSYRILANMITEIRAVLKDWEPRGFGAAEFYGEAAQEALSSIESILNPEEKSRE